ncbi:MAG: cob(I)yrinic acid a,c-diamide adenosyltransferase [Candidatus Paceibacterota bacterium]
MIIVFTGNGKGKTTAAFGQAIRALGQGKKVLIIQFIKGSFRSGEEFFTKKLRIIKGGKGFVGILGDKLPFSEHKKAAQKTLKLAAQKIKSKKYDLIVLDEINVAVNLKLIKEIDVLKILKGIRTNLRQSASNLRQSALVVILTGRSAPKSFIKQADLVTEMKEVKHPFKKGVRAKKGIEF